MIAVFSDIYYEILRTAFFYLRLPMFAFSFVRKPVFMLK